MLQAIILNKAGRNISSGEIHWKELFKASEDSLTSTIFGLLFYLPKELFWDILLKSCYGNLIPNYNAQIISYCFWPRWDANETKNSNHIEPDIFISTSEYDIIIEAKRYDNSRQDDSQWQAEIQGYINEFGSHKKFYLIALGGVDSHLPEEIIYNKTVNETESILIIKCRWSKILENVKDVFSRIEKERHLLNSMNSVYNILSDIILGFRIHGFYTGEWFDKFDFENLLNIDYNSISVLMENSLERDKFRWKELLSYTNINLSHNKFLEEKYE